MIESVYSSETRRNTESALVKIPKNVRQVGQANELKKIYIEDYVMSYIKQIGMRKNAASNMIVLLGQFMKMDDCQCIFISGAVEAEDVLIEENLILTNEAWNAIYEKIKEYFTDIEIVGWGLIKAGLSLSVDEKIRKIHVDNFAGQDKTLLLYDSLEREDTFYVYEENKLRRQAGYYIYYDKNPQMQSYMISMKRGKGIERGIEKAQLHTMKKPTIKMAVKAQKLPSSVLYGAGIVASVVVLVLCVAALNGNSVNKKADKGQSALSENVVSVQPDDKTVMESMLPIETVQSTLSAIVSNTPSLNSPSESVKEKVVTTSNAPVQTTDKQAKAKKTVSTQNSSSPSPAKTESSSSQQAKSKKTSKQTSSSAAIEYDYYVVKKGDTLVSICKKLNKTTAYIKKIKTLNDIDDTDKITIGQKILLP